ncbi:MFS transporter [Acinetobacter guerrae]|uniref:MFS transporter n=1 Tax=Acinetobacter guerrae TaxID=1843371 RepID=A0A3A8EJS9_9GAMM|nr:MFS transporter [Acinetobacter guerrae]RKG31000.1 MFS transporter [Acinetobacter guerrae]
MFKTAAAWPLLALMMGAFSIGLSEFLPMGLLPEIAFGMNVSIAQAGLLITGYGVGVMVGAPVISLLLRQMAWRNALILLMSFFILGNLMAALAQNYNVFMLARIITSLNHGAFFGIGSVLAASLVPLHKQGQAVATMFLGLSIASILGMPLLTYLGQHFGWHISFWILTAIGTMTLLMIGKTLPITTEKPHQSVKIKSEILALFRPMVLLALFTTIFAFGSMFTLYTYLVPMLQTFTQASQNLITIMLFLIGIGFFIGTQLGGKFADYSINKTLIGCVSLLMIIMLLFPWMAKSVVGAGFAILVFGASAFAMIPPLQMRVMTVAHDAPTLASAVNIGSFNLGNAIGAAVGGLMLSLHLGYVAVCFAGAGLAGLGLLLVLLQIHFSRSVPSKQQFCS